MREDQKLETILGYRPLVVETARQWLDIFHDEELVKGRPLQDAFVPLESAPLAGLKEASRQVVATHVQTAKPGWEVTFMRQFVRVVSHAGWVLLRIASKALEALTSKALRKIAVLSLD